MNNTKFTALTAEEMMSLGGGKTSWRDIAIAILIAIATNPIGPAMPLGCI